MNLLFGLIRSTRYKVQYMPALVWSEVPLAMLVKAQADSNCSMVLSLWLRNSTSLIEDNEAVAKEAWWGWSYKTPDGEDEAIAKECSKTLARFRGWSSRRSEGSSHGSRSFARTGLPEERFAIIKLEKRKQRGQRSTQKSARFQQITWSCLWPSGLWIPFCISSMESRGDCLFSCSGLRREGLPGTRSSISPQGQVFVRPNIPPLGQHVILLVLPQLDRDLPYTTIETTGFIRVQQPHSFFSAVRHCPCLCSWSS